jgi:hypothetical protein
LKIARRSVIRRLLVLAALMSAAVCTVCSAADDVPPDLNKLISHIGDAAKRKDFATLRASMGDDFIWSFSGKNSADTAINEWHIDPKYLTALVLATHAKCGRVDKEYIQCPAKPGTAFRAGFHLVGKQWKMAYFVDGD